MQSKLLLTNKNNKDNQESYRDQDKDNVKSIQTHKSIDKQNNSNMNHQQIITNITNINNITNITNINTINPFTEIMNSLNINVDNKSRNVQRNNLINTKSSLISEKNQSNSYQKSSNISNKLLQNNKTINLTIHGSKVSGNTNDLLTKTKNLQNKNNEKNIKSSVSNNLFSSPLVKKSNKSKNKVNLANVDKNLILVNNNNLLNKIIKTTSNNNNTINSIKNRNFNNNAAVNYTNLIPEENLNNLNNKNINDKALEASIICSPSSNQSISKNSNISTTFNMKYSLATHKPNNNLFMQLSNNKPNKNLVNEDLRSIKPIKLEQSLVRSNIIGKDTKTDQSTKGSNQGQISQNFSLSSNGGGTNNYVKLDSSKLKTKTSSMLSNSSSSNVPSSSNSRNLGHSGLKPIVSISSTNKGSISKLSYQINKKGEHSYLKLKTNLNGNDKVTLLNTLSTSLEKNKK